MTLKIAALIVAAGKGERAGEDVPKQFALLRGKAVLAHSFDAFAAHEDIGPIYVVIGEDQRQMAEEALKGREVAGFITGGAERQHSVKAGLDVMAAEGDIDAVMIHDAARPFLSAEIIKSLSEALGASQVAIPTFGVVDSLAHGDGLLGSSVSRLGLFHVQTPQAFHLSAILKAHDAWQGSPATDDAQIARAAGIEVMMVPGDPALEKITNRGDLARMEAKLAAKTISRTGMGFDVHRLEAGQDLWLCGVQIPHDRGLSGHSDADVALHALTDALLGAVAAGDIGDHFPPSDPQWRGAASHQFLTHAAKLVAQAGATISSVDLTIICEAPKIGPHRAAMRARIAELLGLPLSRVSVKATTTERLGFTGRGEGIAAQAIATVLQRII
jgi:2-C-methyl-D-erythritol 4-phosphate cytidylyltransferase / 2-C-methyl-D-erythritol 2,4-cyclodiphosphate synthase